MPSFRRWVGLAALVCAAACDNLSCYDDTDRPEPFPPEPPTALPLDTPTETEDGEFRIVLRAPSEDAWPPPASSVTLVLEVDGMPQPVEMTAAPAYWTDDPAMRGDEPRVSADGPASFRIASAVPDPGLWCLPVDVAAGDRVDGLDVCFQAR
jgi:hypothetical protein